MTKATAGMGLGVRLAWTVLAITLLCNLPASATNLYWSGNGTTQGGVGTWNTTAAHFDPVITGTPTGTYSVVWNNANIDSAEFGGTAGAVTIGANITVNSLTFDVGGYSLAAGSTITFAGPNPTITVNTTGTANTTLSALYTGTGPITKNGTGRLDLNNSTNTLSGGYIVNAGFLGLAAANRLGTGAAIPGALDADWFVFNGGGIGSSNAAAQDLGATRGMTLQAGGAWFGASAATNPVTISAPITGTGDINVAGTGGSSPFNTTFGSGGNWTLTNTANNWVGNANASAGTLTVGAAGVIPDTSNITLTATGTFAVGAFNETVGTVLVNGTTSAITGSTGVLTATSYELRAGGTSSAILGGTGAATKSTSGIVTLSGANLFSGGFNLNAGTVRVNNNTALGAANSAVSIGTSNPTLATSSTTNRTLTYAYTVGGDFTLGDATGTAVVTMAGTTDLGGATRQITVNNASDTISAVTSNGGITKAGSGILSLTSVNSYSGSTTINAGTISIDADGSLGDGTGTLNLNTGTLNASANRSVSTDPVSNPINLMANSAITTTSAATTVNLNVSTSSFTLAGGTTLTFRNDGADAATDIFKPRFSGSGFNFTSGINIDNGATGKTELASFNQSSTQTFSGVVSGTGAYHRGSGTAANGGVTIFSGANTYQGGTTIDDGTVQADNTSGSATGTGPVAVGDGTPSTLERGYLTGTGTVGNATTGPVVAQEGGTIAPGDVASTPGTLTTAGDVTMGLNSHLAIELSGASTDKLIVGGALDLSAVQFLDVTGSGTGPWLIATYAGALTGTFDNVTSGYSVDYSTSGQIILNAAVVGLPGDFNSDGKVDAGDYAIWRKNDAANVPLPNDGGAANQADRYSLWRANFGNPPGAGSGGGLGGSAVPEPSTIALLAIGLLAIGSRRRG